MTTDLGTFIPTSTYNDLVTAILEINDRNPFSEGSAAARSWTENEIKLVLGMTGDIWPREIYDDLVIDGLEHVERRQNLIHVAFPQHRVL
ncbi:hypothetical protein [Bradyrhizobium cosmicum]|uniref:hypothetical protein n=1 Tax=Bradyrhizobium cosmicum TaxID=1404864 RepID=UPI0028EBE328|nr:hypothetical protein [Bradyrhizobium cosmicum]